MLPTFGPTCHGGALITQGSGCSQNCNHEQQSWHLNQKQNRGRHCTTISREGNEMRCFIWLFCCGFASEMCSSISPVPFHYVTDPGWGGVGPMDRVLRAEYQKGPSQWNPIPSTPGRKQLDEDDLQTANLHLVVQDCPVLEPGRAVGSVSDTKAPPGWVSAQLTPLNTSSKASVAPLAALLARPSCVGLWALCAAALQRRCGDALPQFWESLTARTIVSRD